MNDLKVVYETDPISRRDHRRVAEYIQSTAGIQLPASKSYLIEGRLRKRQFHLGFNNLKSYLDYVFESDEGQNERINLIDAITTNKTDFFREAEHFNFLRQQIIATLAQRRTLGWRQPLRIWSAGCSSGEEPYTLAMVLSEARISFPGLRFEITATDISPSVLKIAKKATYPHESIESIPIGLRKRYLLKSANKEKKLIRMSPEICHFVKFGSFNLLTDDFRFPHPFDIIFCRNVMIYFNQEGRLRLINNFTRSLSQHGHLFIGHAESLTGLSNTLQQVQPTIYKKVIEDTQT